MISPIIIIPCLIMVIVIIVILSKNISPFANFTTSFLDQDGHYDGHYSGNYPIHTTPCQQLSHKFNVDKPYHHYSKQDFMHLYKS